MKDEEIEEIAKKVFIELKNNYEINTPQNMGSFIAYLYNMALADNEEYDIETSFTQDNLPNSAIDVYESFNVNKVDI